MDFNFKLYIQVSSESPRVEPRGSYEHRFQLQPGSALAGCQWTLEGRRVPPTGAGPLQARVGTLNFGVLSRALKIILCDWKLCVLIVVSHGFFLWCTRLRGDRSYRFWNIGDLCGYFTLG